MFRGFDGPYCVEVAVSADGYSWRVIGANDPERYLASGFCETIDQAIKNGYQALNLVKQNGS